MISLNNITLKYADKLAIRQLSLSVKHGEKLAIIGSSGAGKSTLLFHLYSLVEDNAAYCSQKQGLVEGLSAYHNVYMGGLSRHHWLYNVINLILPFKTPLMEVEALCRELSLDVSMHQRVAELSGGQRQRVALARALYQKKTIFIGDEPFSALDPLMADNLLKMVLTRHSTAIMVLHDKSDALAHFDRIIGLREGELCLDVTQGDMSKELVDCFYSGKSLFQHRNA
ncbi:ATP-binding cassette domain-containing protein [Shewanella sp. VB17]|uniref:ATP-binding cassette domain-containing protein n=1 Tax=Shewanella sp. VB17 TaxID=2739432 RepID=UPI001565C7C3|nr:ATP-binding cassette domain-containing protein [Shewanella sp. VB17]NRD74317.1 ATP-binding cassette domain-containing protein [Shewanella sp. VB17]